MIVYWDAVALLNGAIDYLLLVGTASLAGTPLPRARLLAAAAFGGAYAAVQLILPRSWLLTAAALAALCAIAFAGSGKALRLTLLFGAVSCALAGGLLLLGVWSGSMERLARGVFHAELSWGVLLGAAGLSYLFMSVFFRGGVGRRAADTVRVRVELGGKAATLRLLRDTGNVLEDPLTGEGVPIIEERALRALPLPEECSTLSYHAVGTARGELRAFRCDALFLGDVALGARMIALSPTPFTGGCCGLWPEGKEKDRESVFASVV